MATSVIPASTVNHFNLRTRELLAQIISLSGSYSILQSLLSRFSGGFILAFHDLKSEHFIQQIEALGPNQPVSLSELILRAKKRESTSNLFAITFDDGVGETVLAIADVAVKRSWPVTFFLPTGYLDNPASGMLFQWWRRLEPFLPRARIHLSHVGDFDLSTTVRLNRFKKMVTNSIYTCSNSECEPLVMGLVELLESDGQVKEEWIRPPAPVTWDEVSLLSKNPVIEFGSHGVSHTALTALTPEEIEQELVTSKERIREFTQLACDSFCYPYGEPESIGPFAPSAVAKHYTSAVTMQRGRIGRRQDFCLLPRIPLYPRDDTNVARLKILAA